MSYESPANELRDLIFALELKSHVGAASVGRSAKASDDDIGGNRPSGGIDRRDDREPEFLLKSADYFRRKYARCRTDADYAQVLDEIRQVLQAWKRMPLPEGQPPAPGDPQWKRYIAESTKDAGELARIFNLSRQRIHQIRKAYREAA